MGNREQEFREWIANDNKRVQDLIADEIKKNPFQYVDKKIREFETGATRSPLSNKLQYEGFLSPIVLKRYAEYMHKHRAQSNGEIRDADNWQKGIPSESAIDSMLRHVMDVWLYQRGYEREMSESLQDSLCAIIFNVSVMLLNIETEREIADANLR